MLIIKIFTFIQIVCVPFYGYTQLNKSNADLIQMKQNAYRIRFEVTPNILELHNKNVDVNIIVNFPQRYFNKNVELELTPVLVCKEGEKAFKPMFFQGKNIKGKAHVIDYKAGGKFIYNDNLPYIDEMSQSKLEIRITATNDNNKTEFQPIEIAQGVIATARLVSTVAKVVEAKSQNTKDVKGSKTVAIFFDEDKSNIKTSELEKKEVKSFFDFVNDINEKPEIEIQNFNIRLFKSPISLFDNNENIFNERKANIEKYIKQVFYNIESFKQFGFINTTISYDFVDVFTQAVYASNLPEKSIILQLLKNLNNTYEKEKELENMLLLFEELQQIVLQHLNKVEIEIEFVIVAKTDGETLELFEDGIEYLNLEELLYIGETTQDLNKKLEIYNNATVIFPLDWRVMNNLGYTLFKLEKYEEAKATFEKAYIIMPDKIIYNNLGAVYLLNRDIEMAKQNFYKAKDIKEASIGLAIIEILEGNYLDAVNYFGNQCSFNAGLANLLAENTMDAMKFFECSYDNALNYYCKAIIGARTNDIDLLFKNLQIAVEKNESLKQKAKTDMEFYKYFQNEQFKAIIK